MADFDFFADVERSISGAEVAAGAASPCNLEGRAPHLPDHKHGAHQPLVLLLDSGEQIEFDHAAVLGRQPSPQAAPELADAQVVALTDKDGLISRNHLLIRSQKSGLVAVDLGSTNGTILRRDRRSATLPPNKPVNIVAGDQLVIGTRSVFVNTA